VDVAGRLFAALHDGVGGEDRPPVRFSGERVVPSAFAATDFAAASIAAAAASLAELLEAAHGIRPTIDVDRELSSAWFASTLRPLGWATPPFWDPLARDYEAADGWVRLHTNAAHHREAALAALDVPPDLAAVERAVRELRAEEVETNVVRAGGCAAALRTPEAWAQHPQGRAVAAEPLLLVERGATGESTRRWSFPRTRPLQGVRVLDLTRVLAGPVATRFLAGYGADVLRIDPPDWDEAAAAETTVGKRCAVIDAKTTQGLARLKALLAGADVLVHGYRPGALEALGLGPEERAELRPGLIDVSLDAYGWSGPWRGRRGFDSLVQMSTGIAEAGRRWAHASKPTPLPFQALDQCCGYLLAAAVLQGLREQLAHRRGLRARCSLARTATFLVDHAAREDDRPPVDLDASALDDRIEQTAWGPARRVASPVAIDGTALFWERPAVALGTHEAKWAGQGSNLRPWD
jgi:hypothetical protein